MTAGRREYSRLITLNGRRFSRIVVDPHYEKNHPDITTLIILGLVELLNGTELDPVSESSGFKYFEKTLTWKNRPYRLVITYTEDDFIGVINAFRVRDKK